MKPKTTARIYPSLGDGNKGPGTLMTFRIIISVMLLAAYYLAELPKDLSTAALILAVVLSGYDIIIGAVQDIFNRMLLREKLVVAIAAGLCFSIGRGPEGAIALILLQLGYIVRNYALFKTREMICEVIEPDRKMLKGSESDGDNAEKRTENPVGSSLVVFEGMAVPVDCVIKEGSGTADLSFITGSDKKLAMKKGDYLPAGSVCTGGQFIAEVVENPDNALYRKLAAVIKLGYGEMTESERRWTRATSYFIPLALVVCLVSLAVMPLALKLDLHETVRRIITVIAVASPCSVLIAVPMTYFSGMAAARKAGAVIRDSAALENAASAKAAVFNKIGTITDRNFLVTEIKSDKMDSATFLKVAAYAAAKSQNFIARAIVNAYNGDITEELVGEFTEDTDSGLSVSVDGIQILLGGSQYFSDNGIDVPDEASEGMRIHMSVNGIYAGWITLSETISPDTSVSFFNSLARSGIERVAMVSGDKREKDREVANELGIEEYYAECTIEDKLQRLQEIKARIDTKGKLLFVGDCQTNARLFEAADIGMMVNGVACGASVPKADIVIMDRGIGSIPAILEIARRTRHYVGGGVVFGCFVKLLIMALALVGYAPIWFGLMIDFCASFAVLLNCTGIYSRGSAK